MANDTTKNPYVIDTAGATVLIAGDVYIKTLRWVGGTTAGHQCVVQDSSSRPLWESICPGSNFVEQSQIESLLTSGIKVPTLGSGKLYIYLQDEPARRKGR